MPTTHLGYLAAYLAHYSPHVKRLRRRRTMRVHLDAIDHQDRYLLVQISTELHGYPVWGEVWHRDTLVNVPLPHIDQRLGYMLWRARAAAILPREHAIEQEDWMIDDNLPGLKWELTADMDQFGRHRERSRLMVWVEGGRWKGFLRNMNHRRLLWGDGATMTDLLIQLDGRVSSGLDSFWRLDKFFHGTTSRKPKSDS